MKIWMLAAAAVLAAGAAGAQDAGRGAVHQACRPDIERLCAGVPHGGGRVMACMREHGGEVSEACKSAMMNARGHRGERPPPPGAPPQS